MQGNGEFFIESTKKVPALAIVGTTNFAEPLFGLTTLNNFVGDISFFLILQRDSCFIVWPRSVVLSSTIKTAHVISLLPIQHNNHILPTRA